MDAVCAMVSRLVSRNFNSVSAENTLSSREREYNTHAIIIRRRRNKGRGKIGKQRNGSMRRRIPIII